MSICLNVFFITKKSDINMIKKGIPNIIPITKDNSVLKMLAKLTYIKLIITPNKNEISGKTTNVNLIYLLIHRCGRSIISLSKPSILKNITPLINGTNLLAIIARHEQKPASLGPVDWFVMHIYLSCLFTSETTF
jgi:hypothetical protein